MPLSLEIKNIPVITVKQMKKLEKLMIEEFGIQPEDTMKKAGEKLAELTWRFLKDMPGATKVALVVGHCKGKTAGIVAAHYLSNWDADVTVLAVDSDLAYFPEDQQKSVSETDIIIKTGNDALQAMNDCTFDLIVDALLDDDIIPKYSFIFDPIIDAMNESDTPVVSLDIPAGLNGTTGKPSDHCVRATVTLSLALPKVGLLLPSASPYVGNLFLADISVPPSLFQNLGITFTPIFEYGSIISLSEKQLERPLPLFSTDDNSPQACVLLEKE
jgi:NAD(P)H-hydrate epimerase